MKIVSELSSSTSQRAHDVYTTSAQRRCNVMTLHRRSGDVVLTSCSRWDIILKCSYMLYVSTTQRFHRRRRSPLELSIAPIQTFPFTVSKSKPIAFTPSKQNDCNRQSLKTDGFEARPITQSNYLFPDNYARNHITPTRSLLATVDFK